MSLLQKVFSLKNDERSHKILTVMGLKLKFKVNKPVTITSRINKLISYTEQLKFILGVLVENTIVEDSEIIFEEIPAEVKCLDCGFHGDAILDDKDHYAPIIRCPECDSLAVEILNGKDIVVKNIVIEKPDDN